MYLNRVFLRLGTRAARTRLHVLLSLPLGLLQRSLPLIVMIEHRLLVMRNGGIWVFTLLGKSHCILRLSCYHESLLVLLLEEHQLHLIVLLRVVRSHHAPLLVLLFEEH